MMDRRKFLRSVALLPAIPVIALAGPTPEGKVDMHAGKLIARRPASYPHRWVRELGEALKKFESGEVRTIVLPDDVEILRAG